MVAANHLHYRGHLPVDPHPDDHATPPLTLTFLSALLPALALAQTVTLQFSGTANFVGAPLTGYFSVTTPSTFTLSSSLTVQATGGTRTSAGYFMRFSLAEVQNLSAIPEPSTYAALAGLAARGLVVWRRRQAK